MAFPQHNPLKENSKIEALECVIVPSFNRRNVPTQGSRVLILHSSQLKAMIEEGNGKLLRGVELSKNSLGFSGFWKDQN